MDGPLAKYWGGPPRSPGLTSLSFSVRSLPPIIIIIIIIIRLQLVVAANFEGFVGMSVCRIHRQEGGSNGKSI